MQLFDPRLLDRTRGVRPMLVLDAVFGVIAALMVLAQAVLIGSIAARAFGDAPLSVLTTSILLLVVVALVRGGAAWGFEATGRRAAGRIISQLRIDLVGARLLREPAALDGTTSTEVATVAVGGVDALEAAFARYLPQVVLAAIVPVAVLVLVLFIDPISAAIMLLTLPLVPVFMWLIGRSTERRAQERWQALSLLSTHFIDVVRGLPTLRAFGRGEAQTERIAEATDRYRRTTMGTLRVAFLSGAVLELAATLGIALIAVTVGVRLVGGSIGFQAGLTVLLLAPELYLPLRNLAAQYHASADGLAVTARLLGLIGEDDTVDVATPPKPAPRVRDTSIRFEDVSYTYPARQGTILREFNLDLVPGETLALVGPSGSGKSTLAALLLLLARPSEGRMSAGGVDLTTCDAAAWRAQISWLPQDPTLFNGTIADNIRLSDGSADDERVRAAAREAGAADFIDELPEGYATPVGEGARQLSAGQTQRIALARAFLRDAPLLILDEPTANLDAGHAALVTRAIAERTSGSTTLVITHREELADVADRVVRIGGEPVGLAPTTIPGVAP